MCIFNVAKANLFKHKSSTISLFVIIIVLSMLMSIGLNVLTQTGSMIYGKMEELNSPHSIYIFSKNAYRSTFEEYFKKDSRVAQYAIEPAVYMHFAQINLEGSVESNSVFLNLEQENALTPVKLVEQDDNIPKERAIYLPYYGKVAGYALGDTFTFKYKNRAYEYIVAGFFDAIELSKANAYGGKYLLHNEGFQALKSMIGESVYIGVQLKDPQTSLDFDKDFKDSIAEEINTMGINGNLSVDLLTMTMPIFTPVNSMAAVVVSFAVILILITLLVIHFRVTNSIEDNIHNIGVLGATGYTSGQIITAFILEYALIALPAGICGVIFSTFLLPGVDAVMSSASGILYHIDAQMGLGLISSLCITLILVAMVLAASRRIKKLPPVVALRGGISTHSFRKNYFPLEKGVGNVHLRMGLKNIFVYAKLYFMTGIIMAGIALVLTFTVVVYSNFVLDSTAFVKMAGIEIADVTVTTTRHSDAEMLAEDIQKNPHVRKTSMLDWVSLRVDGIDVAGFVSNDYGRLETMVPYKGNYPQWENELMLPGSLAQVLGKDVGDEVSVKAGGVVTQYIVSGLFSTTNNSGRVAAITLEGYHRLVPGYLRKSINVYLNDGIEIDEFSKILQESYGVLNVHSVDPTDQFAAAKARAEEKISNYLEQFGVDSVEYAVIYKGEIILKGGSGKYLIEKVSDYREMIHSQVNAMSNGISALTQFISIISIALMALILSMTVKAIVIKRSVEMGILKSMGFLTKQLAAQLAISFIPSALFGSLIGCALGSVIVNPVFKMFFSSMGITNVLFTVNPVSIVGICVGLMLVTYCVAIASSMRIRKISVYELLSE